MRILVLTDSRCRFSDLVRGMHGPAVKVRVLDSTISTEDCIVQYAHVHKEEDAHRLRGQRFDLIIEDQSFNPERSWIKGDLLNMIRATVLR